MKKKQVKKDGWELTHDLVELHWKNGRVIEIGFMGIIFKGDKRHRRTIK